MRNKKNSLFLKTLIIAVACIFASGLVACARTATAPEVKNVTLTAAADATLGLTENVHVLGYEVTSGSKVDVSVKKDGIAATAAHYTYTESSKEIVFHATGLYLITVKATLDGVSDEGTVAVNITNTLEALESEDFSITLEVGRGKNRQYAFVEEGKSVAVNIKVNYPEGDSKKTETLEVYRYDGATDEYAIVGVESYEWVGEGYTEFKPLIAGIYKIKYEAESTLGETASKVAAVEAGIVTIKLSYDPALATNGWVRLGTSASVLNYLVEREDGEGEAYVANYNVTYDVSSSGVTAAAAAEGTGVTLTASSSDTATVKVTYTHKTNSYYSETLEVPVSFVSDVDSSPVLGEDPFGGMISELVPSVGLMLYFDASVDGTQLTYSDIEYSVTNTSLVKSDGSPLSSVVIYKLYDMVNYPYIIVENFENNTAYGTVTVKMTAKNGTATAAASKTFTVDPLVEGAKWDNVKGTNEYVSKVFDIKDTNFDIILKADQLQNMVVSKEGVVFHRKYGSGDLFCVTPDGADNFQIDFDYAVMNRQGNNKASFAINARTGRWEGYCGSQMAFYAEGDSTTIHSGYWGDNISKENSDNHPSAEIGKVVHIRLVHTVEDSTVRWNWTWSEDGETYNDWLKFDVTKTTEDAKIGSPVYALQFNHEEGSYRIGGVKLTIFE